MSKRFVFWMLMLLIGSVIISNSTYAASSETVEKVLVVYQERNFFADQRDTVSVIEELLGNFNAEVRETTVEGFSGNQLEDYSAVFVIALDQDIHDDAMIHALSKYKGRIIWLGSSVEALIKEGAYPLKYEGENYEYITVNYSPLNEISAKSFPIGQKRLFYQVRSLSEKNKVYSWLSDGKNRAPFIIESGNLTYISRVDMNEPLFYIFAEYLLHLFSEKNLPSNYMMVSMQDVHGFSDQKNLRALADRMNALNMPFNIQLIPYFKMAGSKKIYSYEDIPHFVETLKYMESKGGRIIVEAFPVELRDKLISAISFESVVGTSNAPLKSYFEQVFEKLVKDDLHPIGFSSPHGALSDAELLYARAHIMNYIGLRYISDGQTVLYPYILDETKRFHRFYPLNLGYIDPSKPDMWSEYEEVISKIAIVDSRFYGIYFSPDLPVENIDILYQKTIEHQLQFFDLASEPAWIDFENVKYNSSVNANFVQTAVPEKVSSFQKFIFIFANGVLVILTVGLGLFIYLYTRSLRQTKELRKKR